MGKAGHRFIDGQLLALLPAAYHYASDGVAFFGSGWNTLGSYLFSCLLAILTSYGYRFGRSLLSYLSVLLLFAFLYLHLSQEVPPHSSIPDHLSWLDALILSISDMVGRGFFRQDVALSAP